MTRQEFERQFERIPVTDVAARSRLIYEAVWTHNILTPEQGSVWQARASSERHPVKGKVVTVDVGYVTAENVPDPTRPGAMPPPHRSRDGRDEFPKPARRIRYVP